MFLEFKHLVTESSGAILRIFFWGYSKVGLCGGLKIRRFWFDPRWPHMRVEVFTVVKGGGYILPYYLKHYRSVLPNAIINIFDNGCTEEEIVLCKNAGCNIIKVSYPDYLPEFVARETIHKNNIWKNTSADWVIVCDQDELLQISEADIEALACDIVQFKGFNMVDIRNERNPELFTHGFESETYNKCSLFRPRIGDINYMPGAHDCKPLQGVVNKLNYKLLHYNRSWFSEEAFGKKHGQANKSIYKQLAKNVKKIK